MLSRDEVRIAYLAILGREPESESSLAIHQLEPSLDKLGQRLLASDEFRRRAVAVLPSREDSKWVCTEIHDGTEILIHIGLETVNLKGKGFTPLVNVGDKISIGQPLIEVDWAHIQEHATSIITPIIITNSEDKIVETHDAKEGIVGETVLLTVSSK